MVRSETLAIICGGVPVPGRGLSLRRFRGYNVPVNPVERRMPCLGEHFLRPGRPF